MGAPAPAPEGNQLLPPEVAGMKIVLRAVWPILLTLIGLAPIVVARIANEHDSGPVAAAAAVGCVGHPRGVAARSLWVRFRETAAPRLAEPPRADRRCQQSERGEGPSVMSERRRPARSGREAHSEGHQVRRRCSRRCELDKSYGETVALHPLDLKVRDGEAVVLIGHNGSGKTTLLRMLAGLLEPSKEGLRSSGHAGRHRSRPERRPRSSRTRRRSTTTSACGSTSSTRLACTASRTGSSAPPTCSGTSGLYDRADDLPTRFSRGLRQKAAIALALVRPFEVLLVDEPFVGLDATGKVALLELLDAVQPGRCRARSWRRTSSTS